MAGKLYVVGTPIGNLGDMTYRGVQTLKSVDFISVESTSVSLGLLNYFEIKKPLISYFKHNIRERGDIIVKKILSGEDCAIITDAGMPCVSDPGEELVRTCINSGIVVKVVPGPSAAISALSISGMSTAKFYFEGFLNTQNKKKIESLEKIKTIQSSLIFYAAPHKIVKDLESMYQVLGNRTISICRELTKINEEIKLFLLKDAIEFYSQNKPKGEYVLIVQGFVDTEKKIEDIDFNEVLDKVRVLINLGEKTLDAVKKVSKETGFPRRDLYKQCIDIGL